MKKTLLPLLALAALLAACSTSKQMPDTLSYHDSFGSGGMDMTPENLLEGGQPTEDCVWLNAVRDAPNSTQRDYYLELCYAARQEAGLLNIPPGKSLIVTADERELEFRTMSGSLNNRHQKKGVVTETALFTATPEELKAIAGARRVTVKVIGQRANVERSFGPANFDRFRKFVGACVR